MRRCKACGDSLPMARFEEYKPGYWRHTCRRCVYRRRRQREDASLELTARRRARDHARAKTPAERARLRAVNRRPRTKVRKRRWARANRERVNAQNRAGRAANRERARAWGRANARRRRLGHDRDLCAWAEVLVLDPCAYCGGPATGVDHIESLAVGGENAADNLSGCCFDCNRRKRTKPLLGFLLEAA